MYSLCRHFSLLMLLRLKSTLFPYTTLFRSVRDVATGFLHGQVDGRQARPREREVRPDAPPLRPGRTRSEEHTSELQSRENLVCRLLLEKKMLLDLLHLLAAGSESLLLLELC